MRQPAVRELVIYALVVICVAELALIGKEHGLQAAVYALTAVAGAYALGGLLTRGRE